MKKEPKIVWVDSYRDVEGMPPYAIGLASRKDNTVYVVKGKAGQSTIKHEEYHVKKKHVGHPRTPEDFLRHEIEANLYAYEKTRNPKHILMLLRGNVSYLIDQYGFTSKSKLIDLLYSVLDEYSVPDGWSKDLDKLVEHIRSY